MHTLVGLCVLGGLIAFVLGHWIVGVLMLVLLLMFLVKSQGLKQNKQSSPPQTKVKDLRNVGNIPQETLDYLASKKGR